MAQAWDMTVRELLRQGIQDLRDAQVQSPVLDAEVLLAHVLERSRTVLLATFDEQVSAVMQREYREFVHRRVRREPVAYLVGDKEFYGRAFRVTPAVLIPRPETEILLERALEITGSDGMAVDVGTGSGCIAISFALERPGWKVYATDTSADALGIAGQNIEAFRAAGRVRLLHGSLLEPVDSQVGLVMANLPYVPTGEIPRLDADVRAWEPHCALDGGPDGMGSIRSLLEQLPEKLRPDGVCLLELDPRLFDALDRAVARHMSDWQVLRHRDLTGRERVAELRGFTPS